MPVGPSEILTVEQCWELLEGASFGRLALSVGDQPEIFPINIWAADGTILFRTAEGTKLSEVAVNGKVAFETDSYTDLVGWSVVAKGNARILSGRDEILAADQSPLKPWLPTVKLNYVEIDVFDISGRRYEFGPEPGRDF